MAAPTSISELVALIRESGILEDSRLDAFLAGQAVPVDSPRALAVSLVVAGLLTTFQAQWLLLGKSRGFFLGAYKILERLGSGGGGRVFLAEHQAMCRRVAIKVLPREAADDPLVVERFRREARAAANLDHPNIVHAYDVGSVGKLHFLVMEYIEGTSLQALVEQSGPLAPERVVEVGLQAAQALIHLRQAGLVHRDLKPSNLLLDRSGVVKLTDLGLARFFHDQQDQLTLLHGQGMMGTVDYLSPEQAKDSHGVDIRTDIYSLGATLYFLLVGRPPFQGGSVAQKLVWMQLREPEEIRQRRPEVPEGLAAVVRRMMKKNPRDRYQTPEEVVAALRGDQGGEPPPLVPLRGSGKQPALREPSRPWVGQPLPVVEPLRVVEPLDPTRHEPQGGATAGGSTGSPEENGEWRVARGKRRGKRGGKSRRTEDLAVSPSSQPTTDEPRPALTSKTRWRLGFVLLGLMLGVIVAGVLLWLIPSPRSTRLPLGLAHSFEGHDSRVEAVAWSRDGSRILSASENGELFLWDLKTRSRLHAFSRVRGGIWSLAVSPNGRFAVTGGTSSGITFHDLDTLTSRRTLLEETKRVPGVVFTPDGRSVVSCASGGLARVWDVAGGVPVRTFGAQESWFDVTVSPNGEYLLTGLADNSVRLYAVGTGTEVRRFRGHTGVVRRVAFSPDGLAIATCGFDGEVILWETETGREVRRFLGHTGSVEWVGFSPDGRFLLTTEGPEGHTGGVGPDQGLRLWEVTSGKELHRFGGIPEKVHCAAFSPDGRMVVVGCGDRVVRLYDVARITVPVE
jgi:serine/threonine protein kinase